MQDLLTFITHHPALSLAAALALVLVMMIELIRARQGVFFISPSQATQKINHDNAVVIDVRPTEQFQKGHIIDALSLSPKDIRDNTKKLDKYRARPLILVCGTGTESQKIASLLLKRGYNCYAIAGGMRAWSAAQLPLVH